MQLTEDQKSQIAQRLASGASISDIQRLVNDDFQIHMTYMEVRFLIDDLEIEIIDPPKPAAEEAAKAPAAAAPAGGEEALELEHAGGPVRVEMDRIKRPGAALSGSVVFSDGQRAQWFVDPYGRLGLDPEQPGYQPSPEDIEDFQIELQRKMQGPEV